ncbi:MAG TPA: LuxR C-terminal-related transcriptional regulator [Streptosporangiaceae bacterium]|nr:LuxR C-terminal-related transcriptional regulator [Streptosporangiaceae bacterium]
MADGEPRHGVYSDLASAGAVAPASGSWRSAERPLLDRQRERRAIDDMLSVVRDGFSSALVLRGDHGAGKTTLLHYAIGAAAGFKVATVIGAESEIDFAFGAARELLTPFLALADELPVPQRQALNIAFCLETGPPPDPFLVAVACLGLVWRAAGAGPVLCAIDDAHWIDAESALVLGFIARRLDADRVAMIFAVNEGCEPAAVEQLPTIEVGGLPDDAAADLLQSVAGTRLDPRLADRVVADTGGNALALVEVGSNFTPEELAERAYRPEPMPVSRQLELRYLQRASSLPDDVRQYALLMAACSPGDRDWIRRAAADANIDADAAEDAMEAANLIEISGSCIRFRHPLIRTAIYNGASDADRRRAHRLLSEVADRCDDPDQLVCHRAAAAAGPDEGLAAALEIAAKRASRRSAWTTAAGLLRRSIELTPDDSRRARREIALAEAELVIGHPDVAQHVAEATCPRLSDASSRGRAQLISGESLFAQGLDGEAAEVLADASAALAPSDPAMATDALLCAVNAAIWAGPAEMVRIAGRTVPPADQGGSEPRVSDLLLAGYRARATAGYRDAVAPLRDAIRELQAEDLDPDIGLRLSGLGILAAGSLWDDQALVDLTDRWVGITRKLGAISYLPLALSYQAFADWVTGRLDQAAGRWVEMRELLAASQSPGILGVDSTSEGLLHIYRGELAVARSAALAQIREATARGQGRLADIGMALVAGARLSAGECEAAVDAALPVIENDPVLTAEHTLPVLIHAAVCSGNREAAVSAFATLDDRSSAAGTAWARGVRARCLALISDGERAEEAYVEAISQLEHSIAAVDLARAHLVYGQWLRRAKRRRDARSQLRTAERMYDAMGADGFAAQARDELRASGERARSRSPETQFDLTPQEARVAKLAAEGSANREIAEQLFISPSTVEYHLGKVFRKLGVRSRGQLVHALPGAMELPRSSLGLDLDAVTEFPPFDSIGGRAGISPARPPSWPKAPQPRPLAGYLMCTSNTKPTVRRRASNRGNT